MQNMKQNTKQNSANRQYYSKAQFWDQRYEQNQGFFDWYAEFPQLQYAFETQYNMKHQDSILMVGCGNSKLSQQMYEAGYKNIINIDISPTVIDQMKKSSPDMQWLVMDATNMTFEDKKFDYVIDKGTMDALIAGRDLTPANQLLNQCMRVTKQQGQLILITYGSPQGRKKVFQGSLPFSTFDYYFAYINLNDMSTMINLMRNNLIGPDGQKIQKQKALQKSMKEFLLIKVLRQKRPKQKQFVVWEKFNKKTQQVNQQVKSELIDKKQILKQQQQQSLIRQKQQQKQKCISEKQQPEEKQRQTKQNNVNFSSRTQKQSYVYAYSVKRKLGYNFNVNQVVKSQVLKEYQGYSKQKNLQIRGPSSLILKNLAKCVQFCKDKIIAYSNIAFKIHDQPFSQNEKSIKINIKNGQQIKIKILQKTNIDLVLNFNNGNLKDIDQILSKLMLFIVENLGLKLHPCPKTYSLFMMLKNRMGCKTANELIKKYWYPTYKINNINLQSQTTEITLSIPPVLQETLQQVNKEIQSFFKTKKNMKIQLKDIRNGFISFPELQLFSILNMASLSYNKGESLRVEMQDFWDCNQSLFLEQENRNQSNLFIIQQSLIYSPFNTLPYVLLHLLVLL